MHWITLSKVSREVDREVDCEAAYYHPERVWKLPCFDPFSKQTDLSAGNSRSLLASLTFRAGRTFFLTNPFQLNTGTKTLLLVETLSPINGELGPLSPVLVVAPVLWVATLPDYFLPHRWNHAHILTRSRWSWQSRVSMKINFTNGFNLLISTYLIYYPWHTWHMWLERASRFEKKGWSLLIWTYDNV